MQARSSDHTPNDTPARAAGAMYVHIPFCVSKCGYCDFYSLTDAGGIAEACTRATLVELKRRADRLTAPLDTIFIGGGTPTALELPLLEELLTTLAPYGDERTEFSIEANPCTITPELARSLHDAGVNRVNLGAQSFIPAELKALGRIHGPDEIVEAWRMLRHAGHNRLGLDLIYAAPEQNIDSWRLSLDKAMSLKPEHLSCYALTVESDTDIGRLRDSGAFVEMDESDQAHCYHAAVETARAGGLEQYEVSNFAAPGMQCRHNLTYWRNESYLGVGPAAASYIDGVRRTNDPDVEAYIRAIQAGEEPPCRAETLTGRAEMGETLMLALRMTQGADRRSFAARFGVDPVDAFAATIRRYLDLKALELTETHLRIAPEAMLVSNTILADILTEA